MSRRRRQASRPSTAAPVTEGGDVFDGAASGGGGSTIISSGRGRGEDRAFSDWRRGREVGRRWTVGVRVTRSARSRQARQVLLGARLARTWPRPRSR